MFSFAGRLLVRGQEVDRRLRAEGAGNRRGREVQQFSLFSISLKVL